MEDRARRVSIGLMILNLFPDQLGFRRHSASPDIFVRDVIGCAIGLKMVKIGRSVPGNNRIDIDFGGFTALKSRPINVGGPTLEQSRYVGYGYTGGFQEPSFRDGKFRVLRKRGVWRARYKPYAFLFSLWGLCCPLFIQVMLGVTPMRGAMGLDSAVSQILMVQAT